MLCQPRGNRFVHERRVCDLAKSEWERVEKMTSFEPFLCCLGITKRTMGDIVKPCPQMIRPLRSCLCGSAASRHAREPQRPKRRPVMSTKCCLRIAPPSVADACHDTANEWMHRPVLPGQLPHAKVMRYAGCAAPGCCMMKISGLAMESTVQL